MPAGSTGADVPSSRHARWRASWRVALRMARRDLRRHKGRSVLVFLMVAIPVGLLAGAATLGATGQTDAAELMTARMGSGQALVQGPFEGAVTQGPDITSGGMVTDSEHAAKPIPGFRAGATAAENADSMARLLGGEAVAVTETELRFVQGERRIRVSSLVLDPRTGDVGAKASLTGGRWGASSREIAVTPAGVAKGMPTSGEVTLSAGGTARTATVVGTATALSESGGQPDFVVPSPPHGTGGNPYGLSPNGWILTGSDAVTWEEVLELNTFGLAVISRAVVENPPPESALPVELSQQRSFTEDTGRMIAVIGAVMLFIVTTLLVGPAFAVSAARQRRTLALAATNGAETRQLRRTVLAQALVLGVISAIGGVLLGVAGIRVALWWWVRTHPSTQFAAVALDIPWTALAILLPCAVLSAVVAALMPSLRLGRLDVIGVMRGQSVSPPLNTFLPVAGLALAAVGGLVVISAARAMGGGEVRVAIGAIALVLGVLLVVPALLVLLGRLASHLPVAPRMATRDAARHRSRSTPTVAAILAGVAALTAFSIGLASDTKQQMQTYRPQTLSGEGYVGTGDPETRLAVEGALRGAATGLVETPFLVVRSPVDPLSPVAPGAEPAPVQYVAAVVNGCRPEQSIWVTGPDTQKCVQLGTTAYTDKGQIGVLPAAEIARRLDLSDAQQRTLEAGGIAVVGALAEPPRLTVVSGTFILDQTSYLPTKVQQTRTDDLPVVPLPASRRADGSLPGQTGALVATETAKRLGWPVQQEFILLHDTAGPLSADVAKELDERLGDEAAVHVERGFQRQDQNVMRIMLGAGAALILVVTLISTALSMAEQQGDMGTFAAVGATRRTRRALAAAQSTTVGLIGAVLGVVVGLVPGIAVAYPLTTAHQTDPLTGLERVTSPTLAIPWPSLVLVVVGVPLLAGLLSAVAIRRAPVVARRAD